MAEIFWPFQLSVYILTKLITNYTSIGKYRLRFFPNKLTICLCNNSLIKTRAHILHDCEWYQKLWNPKQESFKDVLIFFKFNHSIFCFKKASLKSSFIVDMTI